MKERFDLGYEMEGFRVPKGETHL